MVGRSASFGHGNAHGSLEGRLFLPVHFVPYLPLLGGDQTEVMQLVINTVEKRRGTRTHSQQVVDASLQRSVCQPGRGGRAEW